MQALKNSIPDRGKESLKEVPRKVRMFFFKEQLRQQFGSQMLFTQFAMSKMRSTEWSKASSFYSVRLLPMSVR